jgi:hypothetical protein
MTDLEELVKKFAENVVAQTEALRRGKSRAGNRYARMYVAAWDSLRGRGDAGREALATLLADRSPDVRSAAAAFLLKYKTEEAKRVLREVAQGTGLAAFEASEALQRWEEGDWHLDE